MTGVQMRVAKPANEAVHEAVLHRFGESDVMPADACSATIEGLHSKSAPCRAARTPLKMTRAELSRGSGVSVRGIAGYENGETKLIKPHHQAIRQCLKRGRHLHRPDRRGASERLGPRRARASDNGVSDRPQLVDGAAFLPIPFADLVADPLL